MKKQLLLTALMSVTAFSAQAGAGLVAEAVIKVVPRILVLTTGALTIKEMYEFYANAAYASEVYASAATVSAQAGSEAAGLISKNLVGTTLSIGAVIALGCYTVNKLTNRDATLQLPIYVKKTDNGFITNLGTSVTL